MGSSRHSHAWQNRTMVGGGGRGEFARVSVVQMENMHWHWQVSPVPGNKFLAHQTFRSIIGQRLFNCCLGIYKAGPRLSFYILLREKITYFYRFKNSLTFVDNFFGFYILYDDRSVL